VPDEAKSTSFEGGYSMGYINRSWWHKTIKNSRSNMKRKQLISQVRTLTAVEEIRISCQPLPSRHLEWFKNTVRDKFISVCVLFSLTFVYLLHFEFHMVYFYFRIIRETKDIIANCPVEGIQHREAGGNFIVTSLTICTAHPILFT